MGQRSGLSERLDRVLSLWGGALAAGVAYMAVTLVLLYPVSLRPLTLLPIHLYDTYAHVWALWWYRFAILNGLCPQSPPLYAPTGVYFPLLWTWALPLMRGIPLQPLVGLIGSYNLLAMASFPLTGVAMYLLARDVTGSRAGAFFAGLVLAFPPGRMLRLVGHFLLLETYWLPLYLLFLLRLLRKPDWKSGLGCGLTLGMIFNSQMLFVAYFALPATAIVLLYKLSTQWRALLNWPTMRASLLALAVTVALVVPFYGPFLLDYARDPARFIWEGGDLAFSADLLNLVVPSQFNPLVERAPWLEALARRLPPPGGNAVESTAYLGWVALFWSGVGIATQRRKSLLWCLIALVAAALSLGPVLRIGGQLVMPGPSGSQAPLELPFVWLRELPLMHIGRTPARFSVTTQMAVAAIAAFGVQRLWTSRLAKRTRIMLMGISCALLLVEYLIWWPLPAFPTPVSPFYTRLRETYRPMETAVLNWPMFYPRYGYVLPTANYGMIYQTVHEQAISGGHITRWPAREKGIAMGLNHLMDTARGTDILSYPSRPNVAAILDRLGFGYVVVHKPITADSPADVVAQASGLGGFLPDADARAWAREGLGAQLGDPIYEDGILWAWRVPQSPVETDASTFMYVGRGWSDPLADADRTSRWMLDAVAHVFVEQRAHSWSRLSLDARAHGEGALTFRADGQPLSTLPTGQDWRTLYSAPIYLPDETSAIALQAENHSAQVANIAIESLDPSGELTHPSVALESGLRLTAISPTLIESEPDAAVHLALAWQSDGAASAPYKSYVHLIGPDGTLLVQDDPQPGDWGLSTTAWPTDEPVWIRYALTIPADVAPGEYRLYAGMYHPETLRRLQVVSSDLPTSEHGILVGAFTIRD